jgi:DNA-binding IclR family transcriptional regulator
LSSDKRESPTNSLERALKLLELIAHRPRGYTNSELSRKLEIPASSCSYILVRLAREGYLNREEDGRFTIGLKTLILAHAALRKVGFRPFAEPVLYKLVEQTGLAANIGVLQGGHVLLVDRIESPESVSQGAQLPLELRDIGIELPAHTTGLGKVLLAGLEKDQVLRIIRDEGLVRKTSRTINTAAALIAELDEVRQRGFAVVKDEHYLEFWSLAAPIVDVNGMTWAAVSLTGSPHEPAWDNFDDLVAELTKAAQEISRGMLRYAGPTSRDD